MTLKPTHLDESGAAHMVDVGAKPATQRRAVAAGRITMSPQALEAIRSGNAPKGDVLSTARIAGIMAAKRTADLIPLCHPLALTKGGVDFSWEEGGIAVTASAQTKIGRAHVGTPVTNAKMVSRRRLEKKKKRKIC